MSPHYPADSTRHGGPKLLRRAPSASLIEARKLRGRTLGSPHGFASESKRLAQRYIAPQVRMPRIHVPS